MTVKGSLPVGYRSVLYLPITASERDTAPLVGVPALEERPVIDYCIGVICVHSERSYRFWRWGDHKKLIGGMGDIAFKRSLPYIALITRLIERSAPKVRMEAP